MKFQPTPSALTFVHSAQLSALNKGDPIDNVQEEVYVNLSTDDVRNCRNIGISSKFTAFVRWGDAFDGARITKGIGIYNTGEFDIDVERVLIDGKPWYVTRNFKGNYSENSRERILKYKRKFFS